ncbi:MAG: hypothetical protein ABW023_15850 [Sphingomonas sp.]
MSASLFFLMMLAETELDPVGRSAGENLPGDRIVSLAPGDHGQYCTADARWCVSLADAQEGEEQILPIVRTGSVEQPMQAPSEDASSNETHAVWPNLIFLDDGAFLAGVETRVSTAYSGGGGSATELRLFRVVADGQVGPKPLLNVPIGASLLIRACFDEKDMERRRGACHDEYSFSGTLVLAPGSAAGLPILAYDTEAQAFPRGVSRLEDSTGKSRLKKSDLVRERDAQCSFSRRFRFNAAIGIYEPDSPLPDCSAYTVP